MCLLKIAMSLKQSAGTMIRRNKLLVANIKSVSTDIYIFYLDDGYISTMWGDITKQTMEVSGHQGVGGGWGGV